MSLSWEQYDRQCEEAHLASYVARIEAAIRELDDGRNQHCWPLYSFGGKDADLDPEGCCGIRRIVGCDMDSITVQVGGHKTVSPPEDEDAENCYTDLTHELVCGWGWSVDWDGDSWVLSFEQNIVVPLPWDDNVSDDQNFVNMAVAIVEAAEAACEPFSESMIGLVNALDQDVDSSDTDTGDIRPDDPL